ncbi:hypothetical protein [Nocardia sp. NPDC003963]
MGRRESREERDVSPENREAVRSNIEKELGIPRSLDGAPPDDLAAWLSRVENMMEIIPRQNRRPFDITDSNGVTDVVGETYMLRRLADIRKELRARLRNATARRELDRIQHVADSAIHDPVARQMVADQIQRAGDVVTKASVAEDARDAALEVELRKVVQDLKERRSNMWSVLQRESMAVLIGAFLLIGFSAVMVVAMFTDTEVPAVVLNMILLILGFFFGQSTVGGRGGGRGES